MISFHKKMKMAEGFHDARAVLDQIKEGVILLNNSGSVTFVNSNFQELLGYSKKDLEGLSFNHLINFLNSDLSIQEAKENWINIKNGSSVSRTLKIKHKEDYMILLQLDVSARYDQAHEFSGAILTFRDLLSDLLAQITQTINSSLKLDEILANIVTIVVDYLGLTSTAVFLFDKKTKTLRLKCCNEFKNISNIPEIIIPLGHGAPGMIAERREPVYVADLGATELIDSMTVNERSTKDRFDNRSSIGYPLLYRDELLGVIAFDAANVREFSAREKKIFNNISNKVALAMYNAELYSEIERISMTDSLTDLYNHRYFEKRLQEEWVRASASNTNVCLILLDIDYFKNYNDKLGHLQGNKLLFELAELLKSNVRNFDVVCRFGGDEFTIILPDCSIEDAAIVAERIRKACEKNGFEDVECQPEGKLTISVGLASSTKAKSAEELFVIVDNALYDAKSHNRNKVSIG